MIEFCAIINGLDKILKMEFSIDDISSPASTNQSNAKFCHKSIYIETVIRLQLWSRDVKGGY